MRTGAVTRQRDDDVMALDWRPAHFSIGFDGYDERGMFVAQVVRYADLDHAHGYAFRRHFWRPFLHGVDVVQPGGSYATPEDAMAALDPGSASTCTDAGSSATPVG